MVATHLVLMNHFLMSLTHNSPGHGVFSGVNSVVVDVGCSYGCTQCSPVNGCLACKPPFFLLLHREGTRQTATCTPACPRGFYKLKKKRNGFCAKCTMRGCVECLGQHYCSACHPDFVNFFGKCIKQPPDNDLEELGIYATRPPLVFPAAKTTTITSPKVNRTEDEESPSSSISTTTTTSTTLPVQTTSMTTIEMTDTSEVTNRTGLAPTLTTSIDRITRRPDKPASHPRTESPSAAVSSGPEVRSPSSTPPDDDDDDDLNLCRRRYMRRKERRRGKKNDNVGGKDRRGHKGRRRNQKRRRNRNKNRKLEGGDGKAGAPPRGRSDRKQGRRGCRRRKKGRHRNEEKKGTSTPARTSAVNQEGQSIQGDTPVDHLVKNNNRHLENHEPRRVEERIKLSLLEETEEHEKNNSDQFLTSNKFFYINRPREMVNFKRTRAYRKPKPLYVKGHRVRHARRNGGDGQVTRD
ncbi:uncharacterized protein LOC121861708 [Homarus americanus]|uniref:uncharacterized protein LOC121861708 n=1 Tax=Homarus americanus TaxID=6706 RepID=UPI001C4771EA|nr:uncharacterized protein LOC121861708 [Homarus americanus]